MKFLKDFKLKSYDCVDDIVQEALLKLCGVKTYYLVDVLKSDVDTEFVCGTMSYVKKGKNKNFLSRLWKNGFWVESKITRTDQYLIYYKKSDLEEVLEKLRTTNN
jgi:hypothetical protein